MHFLLSLLWLLVLLFFSKMIGRFSKLKVKMTSLVGLSPLLLLVELIEVSTILFEGGLIQVTQVMELFGGSKVN
jgi:hypothetical protein